MLSIFTSIESYDFSNASFEVYGVTIYICSKDINGQWYSRLLCTKSRVDADHSTLRTERCINISATINNVANAWELNVKDFHQWIDSLIVLGWFNSQ